MIGTIIANVLRFALLVLLQALVLDHLDLANGWLVPYLYVLFILMLPFELPDWAQLLAGSATGMVMDLFTSTPGMHFTACTLMAYLRILLLRLLRPRDGYEFGSRPVIADMGLAWWGTFAGVLVLAHHLWLFFVEVYRFDNFGNTLLRAVLSAAFTLALCLLAQALLTRASRQR
jgi:rod shape-determining protein MreD